MSRNVIVGLILLTLFNAGLLAWQVSKLRRAAIPWRKVFAILPTPMLGVAGSYGVYAFNLYFVPPIVAAVMAAAYETVYIGLPAIDNLTSEQRNLANKIAKWSGWVSFTQNAIAGFLFTTVGKLVYVRITEQWELWDAAIVMLLLSTLHGSQVWVNYHAARLTFHRNSVTDQPVKQQPVKLSSRPVRMRRTPLQSPALQPAAPTNLNGDSSVKPVNVNRKPAPARKEIRTKDYDPALVDEWIRLNTSGMSFRSIAESNPSWPSHVTIGNLVKARRTALVKPDVDTEPIPAAARGGIIGLATFMDGVINAPVAPVKPAQNFTLDDLLSAAGLDRASAKGTLTKYGLLTSDKAYSGLKRFGKLPQGMDESTFASLYTELMN